MNVYPMGYLKNYIAQISNVVRVRKVMRTRSGIPKVKTALTLTLIALLVVSVLAPLTAIVAGRAAQETQQAQPSDSGKLTVKALVLQTMLRNALNLNISLELRKEIQSLVSVNITSLGLRELEEFIARCRQVLARIEYELREAWSQDLGKGFVERFRAAIEAKLRAMERICNVSLEVVARNITVAKDLKDLAKALREAEKEFKRLSLERFADKALDRIDKALGRALSEAEVRGVDRAVKELDKAIAILNRTIVKLQELNVSSEAVEHIKVAIEHLSMAREVLSNITITPPEKEKIKEAVNKTLEKLLDKANNTLSELKAEVSELIERAIEANATEALEDLNAIAEKLDNITQALQRVNITVESVKQILYELAKIKVILKYIEATLERGISVWIPRHAVDKAYNVTLAKALENLEKAKEMLSYIENMSRVINISECIPLPLNVPQGSKLPPPISICIWLERLSYIINKSKEAIAQAEEMINRSVELYNNGSKIEALRLVVKANAILVNVRAWLTPIYNAFKVYERISERIDVEDLKKRLENATALLEELKARFENITAKLEELAPRIKKSSEWLVEKVKSILDEVEKLIKDVEAKIESGQVVEASILVQRIEGMLKEAEKTLDIIERYLSSIPESQGRR